MNLDRTDAKSDGRTAPSATFDISVEEQAQQLFDNSDLEQALEAFQREVPGSGDVSPTLATTVCTRLVEMEGSREPQDVDRIAVALYSLANSHVRSGDGDAAIDAMRIRLTAIEDHHGWNSGQAMVSMHQIAEVAVEAGDDAAAVKIWNTMMTPGHQFAHALNPIAVLNCLRNANLRLDRLGDAMTATRSLVLEVRSTYGRGQVLATALSELAELCAAVGDFCGAVDAGGEASDMFFDFDLRRTSIALSRRLDGWKEQLNSASTPSN